MKQYTYEPTQYSIDLFACAESYLRKQNPDTFYPRSASECATRLVALTNTLYDDCGANEIRYYLTEYGAYSFDCNDEQYTKEHLEREGIAVVAVMTLYKEPQPYTTIEWRDRNVMIEAYVMDDANDDVNKPQVVDATPDPNEDDDSDDWEWDDDDMIADVARPVLVDAITGEEITDDVDYRVN